LKPSLKRKVGTAIAVCLFAGVLAAQPKNERSSVAQSPRQAVIEMITGGDGDFRKHLTAEVQQKLQEMQKNSGPGTTGLTQALDAARTGTDKNFETFDAGPVLLSLNNPQARERWEVRIDDDDLRGDQYQMELSLHKFLQGVEEELPMVLGMELALKQQQGIWRLNAVTVSARLAVGDPRILDKSWWNLPVKAGSTPNPPAPSQPAASEGPKMTPQRALHLIALAEDIYAQKHPASGFICAVSGLVEIGRGFEDGEPYKFMAPEFAQGVYNGYRFSLRGCTGKTVKTFQAVAEPQNGRGKAYCVDETKTLRVSDDGDGGTCLASGRIVQH
jgi:hypothetical protein